MCVEAPAEAAGQPAPTLRILSAPYRDAHAPLVELIARLQRENLDREVAVLIPELVKTHWWQSLLHIGRAERLRSLLLKEAGAGLVVINVPWKLSESGPARDKLRR